MESRRILLGTAAIVAAVIGVAPAGADTMKAGVAFNNGIGEKTASQPAGGSRSRIRSR